MLSGVISALATSIPAIAVMLTQIFSSFCILMFMVTLLLFPLMFRLAFAFSESVLKDRSFARSILMFSDFLALVTIVLSAGLGGATTTFFALQAMVNATTAISRKLFNVFLFIDLLL